MATTPRPLPRYSPEEVERLVRILRERLFTRTDVVAARMPRGNPRPVEVGDELDALLRAHVEGATAPKAVARYTTRRGATKVHKDHFRLGSYTPDAEGNTRWLCLDFDGADHADGLTDPQAAVLAAARTCSALKLPAHIEQSGGGQGWHLWVLFDEPVPAKAARRLARHIAPADQPLVSGRLADANVNRGIEVFPKQDRIRKKKGYGNLVWLPFWSEAPEGANEFYQVDDEGGLTRYLPEDLAPVDTETYERILAELPAPQKKGSVRSAPAAPPDPSRVVASDEAVQTFLSRVDREEDDASTDHAPSADWAAWRAQALASLPLEAVYGEWLTGGYGSENWLECRDPKSESGDRDPSAGVADGNGEAARATFHSFRDDRKLSVFDFMVEQGQAASFGEAVRRVAELSGVALPAPKQTPASKPRSTVSSRGGFPVIVTNARQLRDIIADARHVVNHTNGMSPFLFNRAGRPVRLVHVDGRPHLEYVDETAMYGTLARIADWVRRTDEGDFDVMPPHDVARDLVSNTDPALPHLDAIVTAPMFDREGYLAATPGYHREAGLWFHEPTGFSVPPVPESPTAADIARARSLLCDELLTDFPFVSQSDRAHAIAGIILPFVRRMIDGPTPIHLFEAPTPGAGKSLLADAITVIATGKQAEPTTIGRDDEETRKKITSVLALGKQVILIDNVRAGIDSASLAAALTSDTWQDRILGQSKMILLPNRAVWLVTANNPDLSLEIARRSIRIRIEPADDRPWKRKGFKHSPLIPWVRQHRAELVHAVLVLVRAWQAGGSPSGTRTLGSFESWSEVIGGILEATSIEGFLQNSEELYEAADREGQDWREFVTAWWEEYGDEPRTAGDLLELARDREMLLSVLGTKSERSQNIRLGKALASNRNRRFAGFKLQNSRSRTNQNLWWLTDTSSDRDTVDHDQQLSLVDASEGADAGGAGGANPNLLHNLLHKNKPENNGLQEVQEVQEVNSTYAREADPVFVSHARDAHATRARGEDGKTSCNLLHLLHSEENQQVEVQEVAQEVDSTPPAPPAEATNPISTPYIDLAQVADEEGSDES